ncbi:MAG: class I tRNA ligase family protein, partial [Candidatus Caldarchaeum sp.]|nr:class I tRNA ligase family protein [Candidatus Caldarchaeum sp.]
IWLDQAISFLEADIWRYYLVKIRPETSDSNFSYDGLQAAVNADLNDTLGNFVHRVFTFIFNYFGGVVPSPRVLTAEDEEMLAAVERAFAEVDGLLADVKERQALEAAVQLARDGNVYFNRREPWKLVKTNRDEAAAVLYTAAQTVGALGLLIYPFTPETSKRIIEMFEEKHRPITWQGDKPWKIPPGTKIKKPTPLFEKLTDEKLETIKAAQPS